MIKEYSMAKGQSITCGRLASSAATTNGTLVSGSPVDVYHILATNTTASVKYLKLYNKKTAPTVGTDVPFMTVALQPSNVPTNIPLPSGVYFNLGLAYAITGAGADADTTALASGDVVALNILYT
jgi:hypothetical protein